MQTTKQGISDLGGRRLDRGRLGYSRKNLPGGLANADTAGLLFLGTADGIVYRYIMNSNPPLREPYIMLMREEDLQGFFDLILNYSGTAASHLDLGQLVDQLVKELSVSEEVVNAVLDFYGLSTTRIAGVSAHLVRNFFAAHAYSVDLKPGRFLIPHELRERLYLSPDSEVSLFADSDGLYILNPSYKDM